MTAESTEKQILMIKETFQIFSPFLEWFPMVSPNLTTFEKSTLSVFVNRVSISFGKHIIFDIHQRFVCSGITFMFLFILSILHSVE